MSKNTSGFASRKPRFGFDVVKRWLRMPDGVRLAATIFMPRSRRKSQRFPVLLELLPYRKDDTFYLADYPTYSYFARHGFIAVKVDIRGTGASQGDVPPCEYSEIEQTDAVEIIRQLAAMPEANGNVGMWGISWSGFNAIQLAMRRPKELKAILAMHASDDLYHDDLHYIDGVLHLDPYHLYINHELGLPRTPHYKLDEAYLNGRFETKPWLFTYLGEQKDGNFWRKKSLRYQGYDKIDIPVYMIGGLLDGYRDTVVRMLENLSTPVRADIGPWGHYSPDDGEPGPNYEWQDEAMRWFGNWLLEPAAAAASDGDATPQGFVSAAGAVNQATRSRSQKRQMTVFVRAGHKPDADLEKTPGQWRRVEWPIRGSRKAKFFLESAGTGHGSRSGSGNVAGLPGRLLKHSAKRGTDIVSATASSGIAAGTWWGDRTGDLREDDLQARTYDSAPLRKSLQIIGMPSVRLKVSSDSKQVNWSVRLEDVSPEGEVSLVTGSLVNASDLTNRLQPGKIDPGSDYTVETELHFTTWTFKPGHRVRLAVTNAQFPMAWPSPTQVESRIQTGSSMLVLPVVPTDCGVKPRLPAVQAKLDCPHAGYVDIGDGKPDYNKYVTRNADGTTTFVMESHSVYDIRGRQFIADSRNAWSTTDGAPHASKYEGAATTSIASNSRVLKLTTKILVESDKTHFHVTVTRDLFADGKRVKRKSWKEAIRRSNH